MKQLVTTIIALSAAFTAFAKDSDNVGFCAGYLLMTGQTEQALEVQKQADSIQGAQKASRYIVQQARIDPTKTAQVGYLACSRVGMRNIK